MDSFDSLNSLPTTIVNLRLQLATDRSRNRVRQPDITQKPVVSLLVEDKLAVAAETRVDFAVAVEVGGVVPRSVGVVQV